MKSAPEVEKYDAAVIGGGLYGARLAMHLARRPGVSKTLLLEREERLLTRASLLNQARVHRGYHYPRSILTSLRSRANYDRFLRDYSGCVEGGHSHYYAVARGSKVTANQFRQFCTRIGAGVAAAPAGVTRLFDQRLVEAVFRVTEAVFNGHELRQLLEAQLSEVKVDVARGQEVTRISRSGDGITLHGTSDLALARANVVLNCTYSALNHLLSASGSQLMPLKYEIAELALFEPLAELDGLALTVVDGPFFSIMPYPASGAYTLSHVRYTPHVSWTHATRWPREADPMGRPVPGARRTHVAYMIHDAARYLPILDRMKYLDSIWETKAIMPRSEHDDSRPILFRESAEIPGLISVLGAKVDNVYDVEDALEEWLAAKSSNLASHA